MDIERQISLHSNQFTKQNRKLLKRLKKSYKSAHKAWEALNYYDFYFDSDIGTGFSLTEKQFEKFQKNVVNFLSQYCKIRQLRIMQLENTTNL